MTPVFQLTADGQDITSNLLPNLLSLTLTDNAGDQSDTLTITLSDTACATVLPEPDTTLKLALGFKGHEIRSMGTFTVDEVAWEDPLPQITITARTATYSDEGSPGEIEAAQTKKSRSWEAGTRLADLVAKIAAEHSLKPYVGASLQSVVLPHTDQTDETDLNLVQRLARDRGGFAKLSHGNLIVVTSADVKAGAENSTAPTMTIKRGEYTRLRWTNKKRQHFRRVVAVWRDTAAATDREVVAGENDATLPTDRLRNTFPDEASAAAAATSRLEQAKREGKSLTLTMPAPASMAPSADAPITISNVAGSIDGKWQPKTVTWTLSRSGLTVAFDCETDTNSSEGS